MQPKHRPPLSNIKSFLWNGNGHLSGLWLVLVLKTTKSKTWKIYKSYINLLVIKKQQFLDTKFASLQKKSVFTLVNTLMLGRVTFGKWKRKYVSYNNLYVIIILKIKYEKMCANTWVDRYLHSTELQECLGLTLKQILILQI